MRTRTSFVALASVLAMVLSMVGMATATAAPATDGWRHGWCSEDEGLTVVVDFGEESERGWEARCRIGGTYEGTGSSRLAAVEAVGYEVTLAPNGLIVRIDGVGNDMGMPEWWMYSGGQGLSGWGGTWELPGGDKTNWFYGVCFSMMGCTPRVDPQYRLATELSVDAPASVTEGAGGSVTVTINPSSASGEVELRGLPGGTLTAEANNGSATFELPTDLAPGEYDVTVNYGGDEGHSGSESDTVTIEVVEAAPVGTEASIDAPATVNEGEGGVVTVSVGPATATGDVELRGLPAGAITAALIDGVAVFDLPTDVPAGVYELSGHYLGDDDHTASATETVTLEVIAETVTEPSVTVPSEVTAGAEFEVTGSGFTPNAPVMFDLTSGDAPAGLASALFTIEIVATVNADAQGNVAATLTAPSNAGTYTLTLSDGNVSASTQLSVVAADAGTGGSGGTGGNAALPQTGADASAWWLALAALLVAAGSGAVVFGRRELMQR